MATHRATRKVIPAAEAVSKIRTGMTVAFGGFVGAGFAEELAVTLEKRFLAESQPRSLTIVYAAGQGDGNRRGLNRLAHDGLIRRVIGGHWGLVPRLQELALTNQIEAYNLPQGVLTHLYRDIASGRPRTITKVGLGTFVDPRKGGYRLNERTQEELVDVIQFDGKEYLSYKTFPIDVAVLRGTTSDLKGNVTMEREALTLEALSLAMAAKNSGGTVIVQVERIAEDNSLNPRAVKIPGVLVDCVTVAQPENHPQTFDCFYDGALSSEFRRPVSALPPVELDVRGIIARRAAFELRPQNIVNLGIGMPEGVATVAAHEGLLDEITLTTEAGVIGGVPAGGLNFGTGVNMECLVDQPYQFDFYDGGGLDIAFLGLAQVDSMGNVNVSKFGTKLAGAGGFINISSTAKKVVFMGAFQSGNLLVSVREGALVVEQEGKDNKFVRSVEHLTFNGPLAASSGRPVIFITERCVFKLTSEGIQLTEIAPGINLERDILAHMQFRPIVGSLAIMDRSIFRSRPINLKDRWVAWTPEMADDSTSAWIG